MERSEWHAHRHKSVDIGESVDDRALHGFWWKKPFNVVFSPRSSYQIRGSNPEQIGCKQSSCRFEVEPARPFCCVHARYPPRTAHSF